MFTSKYVKLLFSIFAIGALITAAFYGGRFLSAGRQSSLPAHSSNNPDQKAGAPSADNSAKVWICPMHPEIVQDRPGTCPICGMDLVEAKEAGGSDGHFHGIQVDTASLQRMGVRLATARRTTVAREIRTYGTAAVAEDTIFNLTAKIEGVIRKLHVHSVGQQVKAEQVVYEFYSPELLQMQRDYVDMLNKRDRMSGRMEMDHADPRAKMDEDEMESLRKMGKDIRSMREKLAYWGMGEDVLGDLDRTYKPLEVIPVRAPVSGFVTQLEVREGSNVGPMASLLSIADTSTVWIEVALYPDQLDWVNDGDQATARLPQAGAPEIRGELRFVNPVVDNATRTARARLVVNNARHRLRPGAFVDVAVQAQPHEALVLPRSAVMRTGRGDKVMLARGGGHFIPVEVETGVESGDLVEITDGLADGAQVAVNGQFLLDAAASLSDAAQRMQSSHRHADGEK